MTYARSRISGLMHQIRLAVSTSSAYLVLTKYANIQSSYEKFLSILLILVTEAIVIGMM